MPRMQTLLDPFELATTTPTPSGVVPRVVSRVFTETMDEMRPVVHSETRAKASSRTERDLADPIADGPVCDPWARVRCWCSED